MASLSKLETFLDTLKAYDSALNGLREQRKPVHVGDIHCPTCGGPRKVSLFTLYKKPNTTGGAVHLLNQAGDIAAQLTPSLHQMSCLQCRTGFTALIFWGPQGTELAIFPAKPGGLATKNTPPTVAYYLDQAWRSQCAGAMSAAVVMYRSALEHLLHEQGYREKTLAKSIEKLGEDLTNRTGPAWVHKVPLQILNALRELGNGAVHTNEGDISKQATFDAAFLELLSVVLTGLIEEVYERPQRDRETLAQLEASTKVFEKKKTP
jgi:hypothetical protein